MKSFTRRRGDAEFSSIVMAGLDPAIQLARSAPKQIDFARMLDGRRKGGHDEVKVVLRVAA